MGRLSSLLQRASWGMASENKDAASDTTSASVVDRLVLVCLLDNQDNGNQDSLPAPDCHSPGQPSNGALQSQSDCYNSTHPVVALNPPEVANPVTHPTHTADLTQKPAGSPGRLQSQQVSRKSGRTIRAPKRLDDYVLEGELPD